MKKVEKDKTAILSEDELDKVSGGKFDERGGVESIPGLNARTAANLFRQPLRSY